MILVFREVSGYRNSYPCVGMKGKPLRELYERGDFGQRMRFVGGFEWRDRIVYDVEVGNLYRDIEHAIVRTTSMAGWVLSNLTNKPVSMDKETLFFKVLKCLGVRENVYNTRWNHYWLICEDEPYEPDPYRGRYRRKS